MWLKCPTHVHETHEASQIQMVLNTVQCACVWLNVCQYPSRFADELCLWMCRSVVPADYCTRLQCSASRVLQTAGSIYLAPVPTADSGTYGSSCTPPQQQHHYYYSTVYVVLVGAVMQTPLIWLKPRYSPMGFFPPTSGTSQISIHAVIPYGTTWTSYGWKPSAYLLVRVLKKKRFTFPRLARFGRKFWSIWSKKKHDYFNTNRFDGVIRRMSPVKYETISWKLDVFTRWAWGNGQFVSSVCISPQGSLYATSDLTDVRLFLFSCLSSPLLSSRTIKGFSHRLRFLMVVLRQQNWSF